MKRNIFYIAIAIFLTGVISLSPHVLIIQYFYAPPIQIDPSLNQISGYIIRFGTIIGSIFVYLYSKEYWIHIKPFHRVILFAALIMTLLEILFRNLIMNIVVGIPWMYQILSMIPSYLVYLSLSFIVSILVHRSSEKKRFKFLRYVVLAILGSAVFSLIKNTTGNLLVPLLKHIPQPELSSISQPPYGINIIIPAYITFMEPTIASFIVFYLIKNKLSAYNTMIKGFFMGGIIITIHAGTYSILQIACSDGNIFYRIFYYGQFLWEYLMLGLLTAYSFDFLQRHNVIKVRG